jgi:hypothetical protein
MAVSVEDEVLDQEEEEAPPPPPPTFSEEELMLAREQAFEQGKQAGLQEAAQSLEQMIGMAMATAAHHLAAIGAAQTAEAESRKRLWKSIPRLLALIPICRTPTALRGNMIFGWKNGRRRLGSITTPTIWPSSTLYSRSTPGQGIVAP